MIKLSILVPIYNVENYLPECLESIIKQTLSDIEIICINDGSTDNSLKIIQKFAENEKRIRIIDKANSGYGDSLNRGIECARGEYIGIVESDDFVEPNMFEDLYNIAKQNDCDIVKSDWFNFWTQTNTKEKNGRINTYNNCIVNAKEHPEILTIQPTLWSAIYKRSLIENNNIKFLTTPGASYQDTSFSFKVLCLAEKIMFTDKAYLYYRQDNVNSSINNSCKSLFVCKEYEEIDKFLNEHQSIKKSVITQKLIAQYKAYRWTLKRIAKEYRQEFVSKMSEEFLRYNDNNELSQEFLNKYGKQNIQTLITNPEQFLKEFEKKVINKEKWKAIRRNIFSVKINKSRITIKLLGKQIINIG